MRTIYLYSNSPLRTKAAYGSGIELITSLRTSKGQPYLTEQQRFISSKGKKTSGEVNPAHSL